VAETRFIHIAGRSAEMIDCASSIDVLLIHKRTAVMQQNLDWFRHYLLGSVCKPVADHWDKVQPEFID
jgi:hypothetical protein